MKEDKDVPRRRKRPPQKPKPSNMPQEYNSAKMAPMAMIPAQDQPNFDLAAVRVYHCTLIIRIYTTLREIHKIQDQSSLFVLPIKVRSLPAPARLRETLIRLLEFLL